MNEGMVNEATGYDESVRDSSFGQKRQPPRGVARRVLLAGAGALAAACDTVQQKFDRYVDRGQQLQQELLNQADEVRRQNIGTRERTREYMRGGVDQLLNNINLPSKSDLDTINVKLNILNRKLDDIQLDRVQTTTVSPGVRSATPPVPDEEIGT